MTAIHGDLHFDNILVDAYFPADPVFVLIDPRGTGVGDPAYDIGKLLFSCEAGYDFVEMGHFDVDIRPLGGNEYEVNVDLPTARLVYRGLDGGASGAGLVSLERSLPKATPALYEKGKEVIRAVAQRLGNDRFHDDKLLDRATFYMALFCLVTAPSHYLQNPDGALALLARGHCALDNWAKSGAE
jgi:hypothetical protein